jgi:hypothetical protein
MTWQRPIDVSTQNAPELRVILGKQ